MIKKIRELLHWHPYRIPLTSQVDALEMPPQSPLSPESLSSIEEEPEKRVTFNLPPDHVNKNSSAWRKLPRELRMRTARQKWENAKFRKKRLARPMSDRELRQAVLDGSVPSGISDTGATSSAGREGDPFIQTNTPSNKTFHLPTGGIVRASNKAKLEHNLRDPARDVDMVPMLAEHTLLSTSKFADADYISIYDKNEVNIYDARTTKINVSEDSVLKGWRCPQTGLWRIPLQDNIKNLNTDTILLDSKDGRQSLNAMYTIPSTEKVLDRLSILLDQRPNIKEALHNVYDLPSIEPAIRYLHAAAGFPTKATWLKAIRKGNYLTWPLLTVKNVHKFFPESEETQHGHMRGQRQGVRSTKVKIKVEDGEKEETGEDEAKSERDEIEEKNQVPLEKEEDIFIHVYDTKEAIHTDQTGQFPHVSSRGNRYTMVLIELDSNSIWAEPMKNRTEGEIMLARRRALARMKQCGIKPKHQVLDNEASAAYKKDIAESGMTYELVPPNNHRRNIAEKAIQTWKDHFISVISGTDNNFPMHLWCQILPQAERQINLLRQSNVHPKISAYAHLYGPHNYNAKPFVPIGMETLIHEKPSKRKTFAQHCVKGYVLGTSPEHYRCWNLYVTKTRATRISDMVFFKHKYITNPTASPADVIIAAANRMAEALRTHKPNNLAEEDVDALKKLEAIFTEAANKHNNIEIVASAEPAASPRVQDKHNKKQDRNLLTDAIAALATPPRVQHTVFTQLEEVPPSPRVHNTRTTNELVVEYPRAVVTSEDTGNTGTSIPTITQEEETRPRRPQPRTSRPRTISDIHLPEAPASNTRSRRQVRTLTQEAMLSCVMEKKLDLKPRAAAGLKFPRQMLNAVLNEETGELMEYRHLIGNPKYREIWGRSFGNELGRLAQGMKGRVDGTDTIFCIDKKDIPAARWQDVTYGRIVVSFRPEKKDPNRVRLTVGRDRINYPGDVGTPTADMLTVKLLLNSVISTKDARFMTIDIKDFYLNTPCQDTSTCG